MQRWVLAAVAVILSVGATRAEESAGAELAERYGLPGWGQIDRIDFEFHAELPGRDKPISRYWSWDVVGNRVTLVRGDGGSSVTVPAAHPGPGFTVEEASVHGQFINDSYWLLFPFQLVWSDPTITDHGPAALPIGGGEAAKKLTCRWPAEGGYTPGDAYDLYLGDDGLIKQWDFRRGGGDQGFPATWDDHRQLGPIVVSLDHHGPEGSGFRLWFTGVQATLTDGTVVAPAPMDAR
ncbi:MAG: hypothetical protein AAF333_01990 [Planctomycetota bacterium]